MNSDTPLLDAAGLQRFGALRGAAIDEVSARFQSDHEALSPRFGERGREACREDLGYHLEFLRPVLEFGLVQPLTDYLHWLATVLAARDIPAGHLAQSLDWLAEFFAANMNAADAATVGAALHSATARFQEGDDAPSGMYGMMPAPSAECADFEAALLAGDRRGASTLLNSYLMQGHSLVDAELHMIQPALYAIGRKWQDNQVSVAQEHLATAIAQFVMSLGLLHSTAPPPNGRSVVLACVEGNNHAVGLQMVADAFQLAGWNVQYLGANVPSGALIEHLARSKPDLLGLSVAFAHQLRVVKDIMARLRQAHGAARPAVIIGGLAINQFNGVVAGLGADGWSPDARGAVESGTELRPPTITA